MIFPVLGDQSGAAFDTHIEGKNALVVWGFFSFCCVFAGGPQALICINTPVLLIVLGVKYLFI